MIRFASILLLASLPACLTAQKVTIKGATPGAVVRAINNELGPQGFKLQDSSQTAARFSLDKGLINQRTAQGVQGVPTTLELHLRFKPKDDALEVSAYEELVHGRVQGGGTDANNAESREQVRSQKEREGMQQLLDFVKSDLEAARK
jgi:hypothetical protein